MGEADRRAGEAMALVLAGLLLRADANGSVESRDRGLMLMLVSLALCR